MISSIYKITNLVNSKNYIGWTKRKDPIKRFYYHQYSAFSLNSQAALHKAIRKYGIENFIFEIIFQSKDENYIRYEMETYFIKLYDSFGVNGYNMTLGGDGISGYKWTKEQRENMSKVQKGLLTGEKNGMYRKTHSTETRKKIANRHYPKGKDHPGFGKTRKTKPEEYDSQRKSFHIFYQDGTDEIIKGKERFCKERGYNTGAFYNLLKGKKNRHKDIIKILEL